MSRGKLRSAFDQVSEFDRGRIVAYRDCGLPFRVVVLDKTKQLTATDVVQSGRPIFDEFFQHLWPYIGNNTANVVFQMVKRLHRPMLIAPENS
ncbi:hypothetical protein TNCV_3616651 [Trichonephila clavipes]|nr:hypothetical protein TNCV_3616651 [Trichonephila clavipes]